MQHVVVKPRDDFSCPYCASEHTVIYMGSDELGDETYMHYRCSNCNKTFKERFVLQYLETIYED